MVAEPVGGSGVQSETSESSIADLLLPGGRVDPEALRRAWEDTGDEDEGVRLTFRLQRDLNTRLDKYLTNRVGFMSRSRIQRLIEHGLARVNDRTARSSTRLRRGDVVEVVIPPPPSKEIVPQPIPIEVLYEDEYLIVLNKSPDIIVHPAKSEQEGTLLNALAWHVQHAGEGLSQVGSAFKRPGVVHRLDRRTSGCIVFAKHDETHWDLGEQFFQRTVEKRYLAVVHGRIEPSTDVIEAPIGPHPSRAKGYRERQVVRHDHLGKQAVTIARVREWYRLEDRPVHDRDFTLVELELKTGRTHQIRVHLSDRGFPIVGDDMYGGRVFESDGGAIIERQALHAALLSFTHPMRGERLRFTAPLREDMRALIAHLRRGRVESVQSRGAIVDLDQMMSS